jgi:hypothetical protein
MCIGKTAYKMVDYIGYIEILDFPPEVKNKRVMVVF